MRARLNAKPASAALARCAGAKLWGALEAKPRLSFAFGSQETKAGRRGGAGRGAAGRGRRRGHRCWHRGARRLGTEARGPRWGHRRRDRVAGTDAGAEVGTEARRQARRQARGQRRRD